MKEVIRATAFSDRIKVGERFLATGETISFTQPKIFEVPEVNGRLSVRSKDTYNGVLVDGETSVISELSPHTRALLTNWHFDFGDNPALPSIEYLGQPNFNLNLSVEFLGHQDRDVLSRAFHFQTRSPVKNYVDILEGSTEEVKRAILWTSPVFDSVFFGLNDSDYGQSNVEEGFSGRGMLFLQAKGIRYERSSNKKKTLPASGKEIPALEEVGCGVSREKAVFRFSLATLADSDHKVRVRNGVWSEWLMTHSTTYHDRRLYHWDEHLLNMAQVCLAFEDRVWLGEGLPMKLVDACNAWMKSSSAHYGNKFVDSREPIRTHYGLDWEAIMNSHLNREILEQKSILESSLARIIRT